MECSYNRPLEQRPHTLNGVCINVANNLLINRVIDGVVTGVVVFNPQIAFQFIGVGSFGFILDSPVDEGMEGIQLVSGIWSN